MNDFSGTLWYVQGGGAICVEDVIVTRMVGHKASTIPANHGSLIGRGVTKIGIRVKTFSVQGCLSLISSVVSIANLEV